MVEESKAKNFDIGKHMIPHDSFQSIKFLQQRRKERLL